MIKRILWVLVAAGILSSAGWLISALGETTAKSPDVIQCIPKEARTLIQYFPDSWPEVSNMHEVLHQKSADVQYLGIEDIRNLDSIRQAVPVVQEVLNNGPFYVAFYDWDPANPVWCLYAGVKGRQQEKDLAEFLTKALPGTAKTVNKKSYTIGAYAYSLEDNIWCLSNSEDCIKLNLNANEGDFLTEQDGFKLAQHASASKGINIWTLPKPNQPSWLSLDDTNSWISMEPFISDGLLQFMGYSFSSSNTGSRAQKASKNKLPWHLVPEQMSSFEFLEFEHYAAFRERVMKSIDAEKLTSHSNRLQTIEDQCQCDPLNYAFNRSSFYATFSFKDRSYMLLDYPNFDEAILEYSALTDSTSVIYKDYPLFKLASNELYSTLLFDDDLSGLNHFVYLDDYLVFASNEEDIKALINQNLAGRTLNNNTGFLGMTDHLLLSDQFVMHNADYTGKNQLIYPFDISAGGGIRYHQIIDEGDRQLIHYAERMKSTTPGTPYSESPTQEFPLDYSVQQGPFLVKNHYTEEKEIIIQDDEHKVHFINPKGQTLWSKNLDGPIIGEIHQIDIYKNGKLQLLFNTANTIYCLDRNGNRVEQFPVSLPAEATAPLALFDYDKNRKYRILVSCKNKEVYNYTATGEQTKGWAYDRSDSPIIFLEHIKIKDKDYILGLEEDLDIKLLKRNGKVRVKTTQKAHDYARRGLHTSLKSSLDKSELLYINTLGELVAKSLTSEGAEIKVTGLGINSLFSYADIDNDGKSDFIISDDNQIKIYASNGDFISSYGAESSISSIPKVLKFNQVDRRVGFVCNASNEIHLIDKNGQVMNGFPKRGHGNFSVADIDKNGRFDLVTLAGYGALLVTELE